MKVSDRKRRMIMEQEKRTFRGELFHIALPVALQCMLQSSFCIVDQIMAGQLGSVSVAAIGLGSKFASLFSVLISAVAVVAGIMMSQYLGKKDECKVGRSFWVNLALGVGLAAVFTIVSVCIPRQILGLYTKDTATIGVGAGYLRIYAVSFLPLAVNTLFATLLRCREKAVIPLYVSFAVAVLNTGLNYVLIFGRLGCPALGVAGAAVASVAAQMIGTALTVLLAWRIGRKHAWRLPVLLRMEKEDWLQYGKILLPILICEFLWSLGENVYASIYGHVGTDACAAMTLTNPIQGLTIGALSGLSQAAGIMVGKSLGAKEYDRAYRDSRRLMAYGVLGSACLSLLLVLLSPWYVTIFKVSDEVRQMTQALLLVFAVVSPVKVQNMILGGGIIRSGGKTNYVMWIDIIGTWVFGVPLGLLSAFVWDLPIAWVYFLLSLEECVRLGISAVIFRRKKWMQSLG